MNDDSYTIVLNDSTTGSSCDNFTESVSACENGSCSYAIDVLSSACLQSHDIRLSVFITNPFGNGPLSSPIQISKHYVSASYIIFM